MTLKQLSQEMYETWLVYKHNEGQPDHKEAWLAFMVARLRYINAIQSPTANPDPREVCAGLP